MSNGDCWAADLTLWCHACQGSHPWFLFSLSQRQESKFRRICLRTQGAVRMCAHKVIRWADLVGHATERVRTPIHLHGILCSSCANSTYTTAAYAPFVFRPLTNGQMQLIDPRPVSVHIGWTYLAFDLNTSVPVSRQYLRGCLLLQNQAASGNRLCSHVTFPDGQLLLPFEHNQCACFDPPETPLQPRETWQPLSHGCLHSRVSMELCCRCRSIKEPHRRGHFLPYEKEWSATFTSQTKMSCHSYQCSECDAQYCWIQEGDSDRIYLKCLRRISTPLEQRLAPTSRALGNGSEVGTQTPGGSRQTMN